MSSHDRRSWPARPRVRRRQTLPSLPATPSDEEHNKQQQQQQQGSWKKHWRCASSSSSASSSVAEWNDAAIQTSSSRSRRLVARLSGDGHTATTSASGLADTRGPHRRLGRTPSSPSVLLSKVKERIREKVSFSFTFKLTLTCWRRLQLMQLCEAVICLLSA